MHRATVTVCMQLMSPIVDMNWTISSLGVREFRLQKK